jgi:hypothetical protein
MIYFPPAESGLTRECQHHLTITHAYSRLMAIDVRCKADDGTSNDVQFRDN